MKLSKWSSLTIFSLLMIIMWPFNFPLYAEEVWNSEASKKGVLIASLEECLDIALKNNRQRLVSKFAIDIAEAQHKQALSAYWPQLKVGISATRLDEDVNFIFPEETSTYTISGLGPFPIDATVTVPEKDIKLMDRDTVVSSLNLVYPVYIGGKRGAIAQQAKIGVKVAKESARRTDLQVIYDVKRMYYGAVLTNRLQKLGQDTLDRFKVTLGLTERLYKTGSGTVKKTDYLRTKVIVSTIRLMLELLKSNEKLAKAALVNSMGMDWRTRIEPAENEIPFKPFDVDLTKLVTNAYQFNPDWAKLKLAIKAAEAGIKEAKSGHFPMIALTGSLNHIDNSYDFGIMTDENRNSWSVGIGMEIPLFTGFRTKNEVREASVRLDKIKQQKVLFNEGLALQVKDAFLQTARAQGQVTATKDSLDAALENRKLNVRAYQNELVETKDVIEAQLLESFVNGQYLKAVNDHAVNRARLNFIVGSEMIRPFK